MLVTRGDLMIVVIHVRRPQLPHACHYSPNCGAPFFDFKHRAMSRSSSSLKRRILRNALGKSLGFQAGKGTPFRRARPYLTSAHEGITDAQQLVAAVG